jgi:hypothetical protein
MAKAHSIAKKRQAAMAQPAIIKNQFFGMLILAVGIGALIVMVRYFIISMYTPTNVYQITTQQLIPGAKP